MLYIYIIGAIALGFLLYETQAPLELILLFAILASLSASTFGGPTE